MIWPWNRKKTMHQWLDQNAVVLDVRSTAEYNNGHVAHSLHMPLEKLASQANKLKKDGKIITCCASGIRSGVAATQLKGLGFEAMNGGSWFNVAQLIEDREA